MSQRNDFFNSQLTALIPRLRRYARVLCFDYQDNDDLVQATLERALSRQHQWQPKTKLDRWVFTIESSIWKNELRSRSVRKGNGLLDTSTLVDEKPNHQSEWNILLDQVLNHVMELPENQRAAILLVYVEGMKYQEAAEVLDIPQGTLMSRLARGRIALADKTHNAKQHHNGAVIPINNRQAQ
ncbi:MAG: sigma-70 family RNA polymerase sigma factor [Thiotrichaceae bacterium]